MRRPLLIPEDLRTTPRRRLFRLFGVDWLATPWAWLSPLFFCAMGLAVALAGPAGGTAQSRLLTGVIYGLMLCACNTIHSLGHILGGTMLGAPMNALLLTATRDVTVYLGPRADVPLRIRIGRAASGPLTNLVVGATSVAVGWALESDWLAAFGYFNGAIGLWTLCPIPTMDGWVIWTGMLSRKHPQPPPRDQSAQ